MTGNQVTSVDATTGGSTPGDAGTRSGTAGLLVVLTGVFLAQFDFFVVNIAGPSIRTDLQAGGTVLELIIGGYAFAFAAGLLLSARLGAAVGYRRMFVIGASGFAVASLLCALSQGPGQLVTGRLLQGGAAAAMLPQVFAHITAAVRAADRARAIGWYAVTASTGGVCGQVLGGLLVDDGGPGWRFIFAVNVPVGLVAASLAAVVLPAPRPRAEVGLDPWGAVGVAATVAALLVPLTLGPVHHWPSWTRWSIGAAPLLAGGTALLERRLARRGGAPIVSAELFRIPSYLAGFSGVAVYFLFFPSFMFTLTLLLQDGLRLEPLPAGLVLVPSGITFAISSLYARRLFDRFGFGAPLGGCGVCAAGLACLAVLAMQEGTGLSPVAASALTALIALGNGAVLPTISAVGLSDVPPDAGGAASGLMESSKQFAGAAGVALIGSVYFAIAGTDREPAASVHGAAADCYVDLGLVVLVAIALLVVRRLAPSPRGRVHRAARRGAGLGSAA